MNYKIVVEKRAEKFISKLPKTEKARVINAINRLPEGDVKQMRGYKGYNRLRVGAYRIIYTVDNGKYVICIIDAGNRGEIYKKY